MQFNGEGIQHIALLTDDLLATIDQPADGRRAADDRAQRRLLRDARAAAARPRPAGGASCRRAASCSTARTEGGKPRLLLQIFSQTAARAGVLRVHPAQGRRRLRRRQLQGAVRVDRARPDPPRRAADGLNPRTETAMLKIDRIHHVAYRCKDAKETVLWYREDAEDGLRSSPSRKTMCRRPRSPTRTCTCFSMPATATCWRSSSCPPSRRWAATRTRPRGCSTSRSG